MNKSSLTKIVNQSVMAAGILSVAACSTAGTDSQLLSNKDKAVAVIASIETGAKEPIGFINPEKYIQHNLAVADGLAGFGEVMQMLPEGSARAKVVRAFQDGDFAVVSYRI